jgi:hypothetical protein
LEAEFFCPFTEVTKEAVFVLLFIVGLTLLNVGRSELEHAIEQAGEFVSPGVDGCGCAQPSLGAADKCRDRLLERGLPVHLVNHLATMADLHRAGRYDRMSDDVLTLTGKGPLSVQEFVRKNAAAFTASAREGLSVCGCSHSKNLTYDKVITALLVVELEVCAVWQMLIEGYDSPDSDWELVYRHRSEDHQALTFPEYKSLMMP